MRVRRHLGIVAVALAACGLAGANTVWSAGRAMSAGTTTSAPARHVATPATAPKAAAPARPALVHRSVPSAHAVVVPLEKPITVPSTVAAPTLPDATAPSAPAGAALAAKPGLATLGRITIPAIGLDQPLYEGIEQRFIDAGPTHWPGTALPGAPGNMVLAGHRTTHTHPFYALANMHPGDTVIIHTDSGHTFTYRMDREFVVANTALWIKDPLPGSQLTIFTCHPIGSSSQRLVLRGTLVASS